MRDTLSVDGASSLNSTLGVAGIATFNGSMVAHADLSANATASIGGAVTMRDTLSVDGASALNSTLGVAGIATFNSSMLHMLICPPTPLLPLVEL